MKRTMISRAFTCLSAVSLLAGCAAGVAANKRSPGVVENGVFRPALPQAKNYGPDPSLTCQTYGLAGQVDKELAGAAKTEGRLCAVAETLLGWDSKEEPPPTVFASISNYFGLTSPVRRYYLPPPMESDQALVEENERNLASQLADVVKGFAGNAQVPRYGLVTSRTNLPIVGGVRRVATKTVLVMQDQNFEMAPVPRVLQLNQTVPLTGTVLGTIMNPKVQISNALGQLETPEQAPGKQFKAEIKCGDHAGRIVVQLVAQQELADVNLGNFSVGCAMEIPAEARIPSGVAAAVDPATSEARLLELINAERTNAGLTPLATDPDLSNVSRSLSEDRVKGKGIVSSDLQQRLKAVDIASPQMSASFVQGRDADELWAAQSSRPGERAQAMNPIMTHVGIGVVPTKLNDQQSIMVTELYVKQLAPLDPKDTQAKLYAAVARRRADARAKPLTKDPVLEDIAQKAAKAAAAAKGRLPKEEESKIIAPLYTSYRTANIMSGFKPDPMDFAEEGGIVGDSTLVGIGAATGTSPDLGKNATFVVILLGTKGEPAKAGKKATTVKKK
jgi:uncharacterized protein YkwD